MLYKCFNIKSEPIRHQVNLFEFQSNKELLSGVLPNSTLHKLCGWMLHWLVTMSRAKKPISFYVIYHQPSVIVCTVTVSTYRKFSVRIKQKNKKTHPNFFLILQLQTISPLFTFNMGHFQSYKPLLLAGSLSYNRAKINKITDTASLHFLSKGTKRICILHQAKVSYPI